MLIGIFVILFFLLFFTSKLLTQTISLFLMRLTRRPGLSIQLLSLFFLPGVILHELAHWLVASILFVPTGKIEFFPQVQGDRVKLGSVQVAKTDIFRMFFIGIAPVLFGTSILLLLFWFLSPTLLPVTWKTIVFLYTVFEIGNTMFSSKKDLEGVIGFVIFFVLVVLLLIFLRVPLWILFLSFNNLPQVQIILSHQNTFFLLAVGIDVAIIVALRSVLLFLQKR